MEKKSIQSRKKEDLQKTINSFKESSKIQAKIIREKNKEIKELTQENLFLTRKLKKITRELKTLEINYKELYYDSFKKY